MAKWTKLVLRLEATIAERAKANVAKGGGDQKSGKQISADPIPQVETREELAKLAGVIQSVEISIVILRTFHGRHGQMKNPPPR